MAGISLFILYASSSFPHHLPPLLHSPTASLQTPCASAQTCSQSVQTSQKNEEYRAGNWQAPEAPHKKTVRTIRNADYADLYCFLTAGDAGEALFSHNLYCLAACSHDIYVAFSERYGNDCFCRCSHFHTVGSIDFCHCTCRFA